MNNANSANNVVGALKLTVTITYRGDKNGEQNGITKLKQVDVNFINRCIKSKIEFPNMK